MKLENAIPPPVVAALFALRALRAVFGADFERYRAEVRRWL